MRKRLHNSVDKPAINILDVARVAGVSSASVSRVLNAPDSVKSATRSSVQNAIRDLGYIPNGAARALSSQSSRVIAAIIPTIDNSIFASGIQALQSHLQGIGYHLLIAASNYDPQQEYALVQNFLVQKVAGLIMMGETHLPECTDLLDREGVPYINTGTYSPDGDAYCVGFDNAGAAATAVKYLVELGHRKFSMIAGISAHNDRALNRIRGVQDELSKYDLHIPQERLLERRYEIQEGRVAFKHLMRDPASTTAIICGNDVLGFGAILEAGRIGISIPEQVSIIGFDDLDLCRHLKPSLSTIQIPTKEMWTRAADSLLSRLKGMSVPKAIEVDINLVVRESTAPPPHS